MERRQFTIAIFLFFFFSFFKFYLLAWIIFGISWCIFESPELFATDEEEIGEYVFEDPSCIFEEPLLKRKFWARLKARKLNFKFNSLNSVFNFDHSQLCHEKLFLANKIVHRGSNLRFLTFVKKLENKKKL